MLRLCPARPFFFSYVSRKTQPSRIRSTCACPTFSCGRSTSNASHSPIQKSNWRYSGAEQKFEAAGNCVSLRPGCVSGRVAKGARTQARLTLQPQRTSVPFAFLDSSSDLISLRCRRGRGEDAEYSSSPRLGCYCTRLQNGYRTILIAG